MYVFLNALLSYMKSSIPRYSFAFFLFHLMSLGNQFVSVSSVLFTAAPFYSIMWSYHIYSTTIHAHLGGLLNFAITNNSAMNNLVRVYFVLLEVYLEGLLGQKVSAEVILSGNILIS